MNLHTAASEESATFHKESINWNCQAICAGDRIPQYSRKAVWNQSDVGKNSSVFWQIEGKILFWSAMSEGSLSF